MEGSPGRHVTAGSENVGGKDLATEINCSDPGEEPLLG